MRKTLAVLISVLCLSSLPCFSTTVKRTGSMEITAVHGAYQNLTIEPIWSDMSAATGMPFDLTSDEVQYNPAVENDKIKITSGRQIAMWSFNSNFCPVKITITAGDLVSITDNSKTIGYYLFFPYTFTDYSTDPKGKQVEGFMRVKSGTTSYDSTNDTDWGGTNPISKVNNRVQGINIGTFPIRFMLAENTTDIKTNRDTYPAGTYRATVTVKIEGT